MLIIIMLFLGGFYIVKEQQTNIKDWKSLYNFGKVYFKWVGQVTKNVTALVVQGSKMKWLPEVNKNQTNVNINMPENTPSPDNSGLNNSATINLPV